MAPSYLTLLGIALAAACLVSCRDPNAAPRPESVEIGGETFTLEVRRDDEGRAAGMMGWTEVPDHEGLIFVFPDAAVRRFWMKNCLIDIDVIYLDGRGRITATYTMRAETPQADDETDSAYQARLLGYSSRLPSQFAIELRAGSIDRLDLRIEQSIDLDLDRLKSTAR